MDFKEKAIKLQIAAIEAAIKKMGSKSALSVALDIPYRTIVRFLSGRNEMKHSTYLKIKYLGKD